MVPFCWYRSLLPQAFPATHLNNSMLICVCLMAFAINPFILERTCEEGQGRQIVTRVFALCIYFIYKIQAINNTMADGNQTLPCKYVFEEPTCTLHIASSVTPGPLTLGVVVLILDVHILLLGLLLRVLESIVCSFSGGQGV